MAMEVGPNQYSHETAPQPDLLAVFADREVSIFGIQGTFKYLSEVICPVDLSDARVTVEAKNEFVVKAANEAGLAIEPEYEEVFAQVIERHGLERKFTIAPAGQISARNEKPVPEAINSIGTPPHLKEAVQLSRNTVHLSEEEFHKLPVTAAFQELEIIHTGPSALTHSANILDVNAEQKQSVLEPTATSTTEKATDAPQKINYKPRIEPAIVQQEFVSWVRPEKVQPAPEYVEPPNLEVDAGNHLHDVKVRTESHEQTTLVGLREPATNVMRLKPLASIENFDLPQKEEGILLSKDLPHHNETADEYATSFEDILLPIKTEISSLVETTSLLAPLTAETAFAVVIPELPAPVQEIEDAIIKISEALEVEATDEKEVILDIIAEIVALPFELQEAGMGDQGIEDKLEELFTKLFEAADIEYSQELVESFVKLTQLHYFETLIQYVTEEKEPSKKAREFGTREFLQKISQGLSNMKRAIVNIYGLGKSAIQLYSLNSIFRVALQS